MDTTPTLDDLSNVSLRQLRYLASVGGDATFADVAAELDITQSALSQGIARLETLLGVTLVEPVGRRRRLTAAGRQVAHYAGTVLEASETLLATIGEHREGRAGTLRVGMVDAAALYLFDQAIADFHSSRPDVELAMVVDSSDALLERVARFRDEIAVVVSPATGFTTTELAHEPLHLYGPATAPEESSWVLYPTGSHTRFIVDAGLSRLGHAPRVVIESGNPEVQSQLARLTDSWTVLPERVGEVGQHPLVRRHDTVAVRTFVAATRTGAKLSPIAASFVQALLDR